MNVGGGGPGGNMMTMNMQVSVINNHIYQNINTLSTYSEEIANRNRSFPFQSAANVWATASTATSATKSATNVKYNGTTTNDLARQPDDCTSTTDDELRDATTTTTPTAGELFRTFLAHLVGEIL